MNELQLQLENIALKKQLLEANSRLMQVEFNALVTKEAEVQEQLKSYESVPKES
jgi:hypothetical protein